MKRKLETKICPFYHSNDVVVLRQRHFLPTCFRTIAKCACFHRFASDVRKYVSLVVVEWFDDFEKASSLWCTDDYEIFDLEYAVLILTVNFVWRYDAAGIKSSNITRMLLVIGFWTFEIDSEKVSIYILRIHKIFIQIWSISYYDSWRIVMIDRIREKAILQNKISIFENMLRNSQRDLLYR